MRQVPFRLRAWQALANTASAQLAQAVGMPGKVTCADAARLTVDTASHLFTVPFAIALVSMLFLKVVPTQNVVIYTSITALVVLVGLFLYATVRKFDPSENRYGPNPYEVPK